MTPAEQAARFERLLGAELAAIGRVAASYEADPSRRQDLLQEISIALWRALPAFRGESSERTFALRIAHHRAVTYSMRRPPAGRSLDAALELPAPEPGPEADAVASQRRARLHRAIRALPLGMLQVLTLALEGLSNREVGEVVPLQFLAESAAVLGLFAWFNPQSLPWAAQLLAAGGVIVALWAIPTFVRTRRRLAEVTAMRRELAEEPGAGGR